MHSIPQYMKVTTPQFQQCQTHFIKTHGSVSCSPRKQDARERSEYIDWNNKVTIFTHM